MRYLLTIIFISFLLNSCQRNNIDINQFRTGTFKTFLNDNDVTSLAIRNDSTQIEIYNDVKDTFDIEWKSNFEYVLMKSHPKNELDSTPFHVKITGLKDNSYTFKANYKGSNFVQKGKAIKLKD